MTNKIISIDSSSYKKDWWDVEIINNPMKIYIQDVGRLRYFIQLNPTDHRGLRAIIGVQDKRNIRRFFNMLPTEFSKLDVKENILKLACKWSTFLENRFNCVTQMAILGNNSQTQDNNQIILGKYNEKMEPYFYHIHVWIRTVPGTKLYQDYNFLGPKMGEIMNLRLGKKRYLNVDNLVEKLREDFKKFL